MVEEHVTQFVKQVIIVVPTNENPALYSPHVSVVTFDYQVLQFAVNVLATHVLSDFNQYPSLHAVHTYEVASELSIAMQFAIVINASLLQILSLFKNHKS